MFREAYLPEHRVNIIFFGEPGPAHSQSGGPPVVGEFERDQTFGSADNRLQRSIKCAESRLYA